VQYLISAKIFSTRLQRRLTRDNPDSTTKSETYPHNTLWAQTQGPKCLELYIIVTALCDWWSKGPTKLWYLSATVAHQHATFLPHCISVVLLHPVYIVVLQL